MIGNMGREGDVRLVSPEGLGAAVRKVVAEFVVASSNYVEEAS